MKTYYEIQKRKWQKKDGSGVKYEYAIFRASEEDGHALELFDNLEDAKKVYPYAKETEANFTAIYS